MHAVDEDRPCPVCGSTTQDENAPLGACWAMANGECAWTCSAECAEVWKAQRRLEARK